MKKTALLLLTISLLSLGCTTTKQTKADQQKKTMAAKRAVETPPPIAKLLPNDQLNEQNAHDQAFALEQTLNRENGLNSGQTAKVP